MERMRSAFICYSTDASKKAVSVSKYLDSLDVDSFRFEKELSKKMEGLPARIKLEIETRNALILILSAESKNSPWVSHELGMASGLNKPIFVFKTAHNLTLPNYLDTFQVIVLEKTNELVKYFGRKAAG